MPDPFPRKFLCFHASFHREPLGALWIPANSQTFREWLSAMPPSVASGFSPQDWARALSAGMRQAARQADFSRPSALADRRLLLDVFPPSAFPPSRPFAIPALCSVCCNASEIQDGDFSFGEAREIFFSSLPSPRSIDGAFSSDEDDPLTLALFRSFALSDQERESSIREILLQAHSRSEAARICLESSELRLPSASRPRL